MTQSQKIRIINDTLKRYFANTSTPRKVLAKDLMPEFIKAGAFPADYNNGLPIRIRNLLRDLDKATKHGIKVIVIDYTRFGTSKKIKRSHDKDIQIVKQILVENGII